MRGLEAKAPRGKAGNHRYVVRSIPLGDAQRACDHVGLQPAVGVREEDPVAGGGACTEGAGVTLAKPALRQSRHSLHLQARVFNSQSLEDFSSAVGGPVVDNNDLKLDAS